MGQPAEPPRESPAVLTAPQPVPRPDDGQPRQLPAVIETAPAPTLSSISKACDCIPPQ